VETDAKTMILMGGICGFDIRSATEGLDVGRAGRPPDGRRDAGATGAMLHLGSDGYPRHSPRSLLAVLCIKPSIME
jgi:hypothetical protein